jgi:hypothetical protein
MQHLQIQFIQIGHKFGFVICIFLGSCNLFEWDTPPEAKYWIFVKNESLDALVLIREFNNGTIHSDSFPILALGSTYLDDNVILKSKKQDPLKEVFSDIASSFTQSAKILKGDSLVAYWEGPPKEMGDSVHHFFNYSSWEVIQYPADSSVNGIIQFTITEEDLKKK